MRALACLVVCTLVACSKPSEPAGAGATSASAADASVTAAATGGQAPVGVGTALDAGTPDAGSSEPRAESFCATLASRYDAIQKAAPLDCKVDADCSCHLVLTQNRVLAVSDRATAAKLQALSMAYRKARCSTTSPASSQPACEPKCQADKCR